MALGSQLNIDVCSFSRLVRLSVAQSALLASGQMMLKVAVADQPDFSLTTEFLRGLLSNGWWIVSLLIVTAASLMWLRILRNFPLSLAYPMASLTYVFALVFSVLILGEPASWNRWLGVGLIIAGCFFVTGGDSRQCNSV